MTSTFGMIATLGYSFAAVFTLLAVVYYFLRHVRAVRDEMTGKTAQREIADIRSGRRGRSWLGTQSSGIFSDVHGAQRTPAGTGSGSLHVRNVEVATNVITPLGENDSELSTTLLSSQASSTTSETEAGTTLLSSQSDSETETTLLSQEGEVRK